MAGRAMAPLPAAALPTVTFGDSLRFQMNGEAVTLLHLPAAHTDGDIAVHFHGSNVLATGDVFVPHMPWISIDQGADVGGLLDALDLLIARVPEDVRIAPEGGRNPQSHFQ